MTPCLFAPFWPWRTFLHIVLWISGGYCQSLYDVRLVGGSQSNEGRVEIYYSYQWYTICDNLWGLQEAQVVCRHLGYGTVDVVARRSAYFGQGTGRIAHALCDGSETGMSLCTIIVDSGTCFHSEDAGVECGDDPLRWPTPTTSATTVYNGGNTVRLMGGPTSRQGRVEIFYNGQWNTICDDYWGDAEAQVVCRQLGFSTDNAVVRKYAYFGRGSGPILHAQCYGYGWEYTLESCTLSHGGLCTHSEDSGVECGHATSPRVVAVMSFVGVALFLLTILAIFAVWYVCRQRKHIPPPQRHGTEMQQISPASNAPGPTQGPSTSTTVFTQGMSPPMASPAVAPAPTLPGVAEPPLPPLDPRPTAPVGHPSWTYDHEHTMASSSNHALPPVETATGPRGYDSHWNRPGGVSDTLPGS